MHSSPRRRARDLEFFLNDDASITPIVIDRPSRTSNDRIHRYSVRLAVYLLRGRVLRFQRDVPEILPELAQLLKPSGRGFGGVGGAGFVGDGVVRVGGAVFFPGLEDLRNDNGESAAYDCADHLGDCEDEEDNHAICTYT